MQSPIDFSALSGLLKFLLPGITSVQYFFTKDFIKERYYLHLLVSLVLTFISMRLLFLYFSLGDTPTAFIIFIGWFGAYLVNWVREWYYAKYHEAPFSFTDIIFGGYGGILGSIIYILM